MDIKNYIEARKKSKEILLMTHQVIGYPDFETNEKVIESFYKNGVDFVELQIPFSDPVADGPLFCKSNQLALERGVTVKKCFDFVDKMCIKYPMTFLIMTYYNILYQYGLENFAQTCGEKGVKGLIVPDAPIDDAADYFRICKEKQIDAIGLVTPYTDEKRLREISEACGDFIYYVPRKGVTGTKTSFDQEIIERIKFVKEITQKPIAVGFGIQNADDIAKIKGVCDIAIIGSKLRSVLEEGGVSGLDVFLKEIMGGILL